MDGASRDAWDWIDLAGVGLVFLGSLIVMLDWLQASREARRIADQRPYEWGKERLDRIDLYSSQLAAASYELRDEAGKVLLWTMTWWQAPRSERPQITPLVEGCVETLQDALNRADDVRTNPPEIIFCSLRHEIVDGTRKSIVSFNRLWGACEKLLSERKEASRQASDSRDLSSVKIWEREWRDKVTKEFRSFKTKHIGLVEAMHRALEPGHRRPSLLKRLGRALFSKEGWEYWLILAGVALFLVGWAIARGIIPWPLGGGIHWFWSR